MHKYAVSPTVCGTVQRLLKCPTARRSPLISARRPAVRRGLRCFRDHQSGRAQRADLRCRSSLLGASLCLAWRCVRAGAAHLGVPQALRPCRRGHHMVSAVMAAVRQFIAADVATGLTRVRTARGLRGPGRSLSQGWPAAAPGHRGRHQITCGRGRARAVTRGSPQGAARKRPIRRNVPAAGWTKWLTSFHAALPLAWTAPGRPIALPSCLSADRG